MPKHQVSTINTESPNNTTFLNHENPYGPADLVRTYDVLIPNDANILLPVSHEPGVVENTRKSEGKVKSLLILYIYIYISDYI